MPSTSLATQLLPALTANIVFRLFKVSFTDLVAGLSHLELSVVNKATKKQTFYFLERPGNHLQCSNDKEVVSLFLPPGNKQSNFSLHIAATAKNGSFVASTIITTQVCRRKTGPTQPLWCWNSHFTMVNAISQVLDFPTDSGSSDDDLVKHITAKLTKQGQLSRETVARVFAVSDNLNNQSSNADWRKVTDIILCFALSLKMHYIWGEEFVTGWKMFCHLVCQSKLRQLLLQVMKTIVKEVLINTPTGVHQAARALNAITQRGSELGSSAVVMYQVHTYTQHTFWCVQKQKT